ncbi:MAG: hypothetical protein ABI571_06535, partial [Actinomycetota bacterium]
TWTVIGLLAATLFGALIYLGGRIDGVVSRIDGLSSEMNARFDGLSSRIDGLSSRVDRFSSEVHEQRGRIDDHVRWHSS